MIDAILHGGQAYRFYQAIETAKVELSTSESTRVAFSGGGVHVSEHMTRAEFESWIRPYLDTVGDAIRATLDEVDVDAGAVQTVLRTGGSSQIPAFVEMLSSQFPTAEIRERPAFTSVAYGLGEYAVQRWGED
jgi:hypothetical chaperone protein